MYNILFYPLYHCHQLVQTVLGFSNGLLGLFKVAVFISCFLGLLFREVFHRIQVSNTSGVAQSGGLAVGPPKAFPL